MKYQANVTSTSTIKSGNKPTVDHDRRNIIEHSRQAFIRHLTPEQGMTINNYENFGWTFFLRDAKSDNPTVFMVSEDKQTVLLIDGDGELVEEHDIVFRP